MDVYRAIKERFGFEVPADYRRFWKLNLLADDRAKGLWLSRFRWLSPERIADSDDGLWPEVRIRSLVPFARTPGADYYCWFAEKSGGAWIADCPGDSDIAEGFAPHFEGFVFRSLLEEFADTWFIRDMGEAGRLFQRYAEMVRPLLRPEWSGVLSQIASREPRRNEVPNFDGRPSVLSQQELAEIVHRELAFPHLGEEFVQYFDPSVEWLSAHGREQDFRKKQGEDGQ